MLLAKIIPVEGTGTVSPAPGTLNPKENRHPDTSVIITNVGFQVLLWRITLQGLLSVQELGFRLQVGNLHCHFQHIQSDTH